MQIGRSILDIEVKNASSGGLAGCLCLGGKKKQAGGDEDDLMSLDGNVYFPSSYASQDFLDQREQRRLGGSRISNARKLKKVIPVKNIK